MTKKDVEKMLDALDNPPEPNEALIKAAKEYKLSRDTKTNDEPSKDHDHCEYSGLPSVESYKK